jgi:hypothetical protein
VLEGGLGWIFAKFGWIRDNFGWIFPVIRSIPFHFGFIPQVSQ